MSTASNTLTSSDTIENINKIKEMAEFSRRKTNRLVNQVSDLKKALEKTEDTVYRQSHNIDALCDIIAELAPVKFAGADGELYIKANGKVLRLPRLAVDLV